MNKISFKNILLVLLVSVTILSVYKYISALKEKYDLLNTLTLTKEQVELLEQEKQNLLQTLEKEKALEAKLSEQNAGLKEYLQASKKRLTKNFRDIEAVREEKEELDAKFSLLKAENTALLEQKEQLSQENESLSTKLSSIVELKKAIRELKKQVRKVGTTIKQKISEQKLIEGNRGFIIKDGKYTYPSRVRIEVIPASEAGDPASVK